MNIDLPRQEHIPQLYRLWQEAFGDTDAYLDAFFAAAEPLKHGRCVTVEGKPVAALYWFDCRWREKKLAYVYAVATKTQCRGQGLCRALMADTLRYLKASGYQGAMLVPGGEALRKMYASMGYQPATRITQLSCVAAENGTALRTLETAEYAALRRSYLPPEGVVQEDCNLAFLKTRWMLLAGEDFLLTADIFDGVVTGELLGNTEKAPEITKALQCKRGIFRTPGTDIEFAMYHPLDGETCVTPGYFGLAFD